MENLNYPIEFIKRTKEILEEDYPHFKDKDREVTFLMNCLLGLILTIREEEVKKRGKVFDSNIDDEFLALVPEKVGFVKTTHVGPTVDVNRDLTEPHVTMLNLPVSHRQDLRNEKKSWLLKKLRHGIAHQNISSINTEGKWVGVRLWNEPVPNVRDFEIVFDIERLKTFAIEISRRYLFEKTNNEQNN